MNFSDKKEFRITETVPPTSPNFVAFLDKQKEELEEFEPSGAQAFAQNFANPLTKNNCLVINWKTGYGKSIAFGLISLKFVEYIKSLTTVELPEIFLIASPLIQGIIKRELILRPAFGFITPEEFEELQELRSQPKVVASMERAHNIMIRVNKRIVDPSIGGMYNFMGYREFTQRVFIVLPRGKEKKIDMTKINNTNIALEEKRIRDYIAEGYIKINDALIDRIAHGLFVVDEVQNLYNIKSANNYGATIRFVLKYLDARRPRTIFMTATPMTGSPTEIVDLINIINPASTLKKEQIFEGEKLKSGSEHILEKEFLGRFSCVFEKPSSDIPRRVFDGKSVKDIPYLKFVFCPVTELQKQALEDYWSARQTETDSVDSKRDTTRGFRTHIYNTALMSITGKPFVPLHNVDMVKADVSKTIANIAQYSSKIAAMIEDCKNADGKIMIYDHQVKTTGVLFLAQVLTYYGFVEFNSVPGENAICRVCKKKRDEEHDGHAFAPILYGVIHYNVNKDYYTRAIDGYNMNTIDIILASRRISEGVTLKGTALQLILTPAGSIADLIQVLGRVVRKGTHSDMPVDKRVVHVKIYVTTLGSANGQPETLFGSVKSGQPETLFGPQSPATTGEISKYYSDMQKYLEIQNIERIIRRCAVDGALRDNVREDGLENVNYDPLQKKGKLIVGMEYYHKYARDELNRISKIIQYLLHECPIWTIPDLTGAVKEFNRFGYEGALYGEDLIHYEIYRLLQDNIIPLYTINARYALDYYTPYLLRRDKQDPLQCIAAFTDTEADFEERTITLTKSVQNIRNIEEAIEIGKSNTAIAQDIAVILALQAIDPQLQFETCKQLLSGEYINEYLFEIYRKMGFCRKTNPGADEILPSQASRSADEILPSQASRSANEILPSQVSEYEIVFMGNIYRKGTDTYHVGRAKPDVREDNNIITGIVENGEIKLRLKTSKKVKDRRKINKGVVCVYYKRKKLDRFAELLHVNAETVENTASICQLICANLIKKELVRHGGQRWFYFFYEPHAL